MLFRAAKAMAALDGRDHALPDDVQALADSVLAHRLLLGARLGRRRAGRRRARRAGAGPGALSSMRPLAVALFGLALCLAAATFDTASLYVPGVALIAIAAGATAWVTLAASGAAIERRAGPHTVTEEEPYPLRIEVRAGRAAPARRRADRATARLAGADRGALVAPGADQRPLLSAAAAGCWSRRRLVIRDPLRLFSRELVGTGGDEVLVLPARGAGHGARRRRRGAGSHGGMGIDPGVMGRRLDASMAELEIDGLRPYREGTSASRIHWPSVARRGEMLERRLVAELDSAPLIVLDPSGGR